MMKKVILAIGLLAIIGGGIGFYMFNKPLASTNALKTDFSVEAAALLLSFEDNEEAANSKYLDKVLEVKGKIEKIDRKEGSTTVYLDADNPMSNIIFKLEEPSPDINEGDVVRLKGICTGYLADVVLVRAVVV